MWLLAFRPAAMSFDSLLSWKQAASGDFASIPSFVYALFLAICQKLYFSPALPAFLQICITSLLFSSFLQYAYHKGVNRIILIASYLFFVSSPTVGIYNITLWKDILFSVVILCICYLWLRCFHENQAQVNNKKLLFVLASSLVLLYALRVNGLVYTLIIPLFLAYRFRKILTLKSFSFLVVTLIAGFSSLFLLTKIFQVDKTYEEIYDTSPYIQLTAAVVNKGGKITEAEVAHVTQVITIANIEKYYSCGGWDNLWAGGIDLERFYDDQYNKQFKINTFKLILRNPQWILFDRVCLFSQVIGLYKQSPYLYEASIPKNDQGLFTEPSKIHRGAVKMLELSQGTPFYQVYWMHAGYLIIYFGLIIWSMYKRNLALLDYILILLINVPGIFLLGVSKDYRYLYMLSLGIYCLPLVVSLTAKASIHPTRSRGLL